MSKIAVSLCFVFGIALTSGCAAPDVPEAAGSTEDALVDSSVTANFSTMLNGYGLERLVIKDGENCGRIHYANGTTVTLTSKVVNLSTGPTDLFVARGSDGSQATMYQRDNWPVLSTNGETHILFHSAASVKAELEYWRSKNPASLALAGLVIDTMQSLYGTATEEALTARLLETGAVPGISNASFGSGGGGVRPMQLVQAPGAGDANDEFPPPMTDAEIRVIEHTKEVAVFARDCVSPFVVTIMSALAASWSCRLCARMITATIASAAGGPVAIITLIGTAAACGICAYTMYSTIEGAVDAYNGCVNGTQNDPFQGGDGGGPGPVRVPVNVAAIAQPALVNVQTYSY